MIRKRSSAPNKRNRRGASAFARAQAQRRRARDDSLPETGGSLLPGDDAVRGRGVAFGRGDNLVEMIGDIEVADHIGPFPRARESHGARTLAYSEAFHGFDGDRNSPVVRKPLPQRLEEPLTGTAVGVIALTAHSANKIVVGCCDTQVLPGGCPLAAETFSPETSTASRPSSLRRPPDGYGSPWRANSSYCRQRRVTLSTETSRVSVRTPNSRSRAKERDRVSCVTPSCAATRRYRTAAENDKSPCWLDKAKE